MPAVRITNDIVRDTTMRETSFNLGDFINVLAEDTQKSINVLDALKVYLEYIRDNHDSGNLPLAEWQAALALAINIVAEASQIPR